MDSVVMEVFDPTACAISRTVRLSETFEDGDALYAAAKEQELEGIMAKRLDSRYAEGRRTRDVIAQDVAGDEARGLGNDRAIRRRRIIVPQLER